MHDFKTTIVTLLFWLHHITFIYTNTICKPTIFIFTIHFFIISERWDLSSKLTFTWISLWTSKTVAIYLSNKRIWIGQQIIQKNCIKNLHYFTVLKWPCGVEFLKWGSLGLISLKKAVLGSSEFLILCYNLQQDEATAHTFTASMAVVWEMFPQHLISRFGAPTDLHASQTCQFVTSSFGVIKNAKFTVVNLVQSMIRRLQYVNKLLQFHRTC